MSKISSRRNNISMLNDLGNSQFGPATCKRPLLKIVSVPQGRSSGELRHGILRRCRELSCHCNNFISRKRIVGQINLTIATFCFWRVVVGVINFCSVAMNDRLKERRKEERINNLNE